MSAPQVSASASFLFLTSLCPRPANEGATQQHARAAAPPPRDPAFAPRAARHPQPPPSRPRCRGFSQPLYWAVENQNLPCLTFPYSFCLSPFTRQQILGAALKLAERLGCTERIPPLSSPIRRGVYFLRANRLNKSANRPKIEFQNDIVISLLSTYFFLIIFIP